MRIKKTSQTTASGAQVVDGHSTSTSDGYSCNYVNNVIKDVFSTNEVKTNKIWINDKPIYRKVFTGNLSQDTFEHQLTNFKIVNLYGNFYNSNSRNWFPIPSTRPAYPEYEVGLYVGDTYINVERASGARGTNMTFEIVLEYTKTTD